MFLPRGIGHRYRSVFAGIFNKPGITTISCKMHPEYNWHHC